MIKFFIPLLHFFWQWTSYKQILIRGAPEGDEGLVKENAEERLESVRPVIPVRCSQIAVILDKRKSPVFGRGRGFTQRGMLHRKTRRNSCLGCYDRRDTATLDAGQVALGVVAVAGLVSVFVSRAFITLLRRAGTGKNRSVPLAAH